MNASVSRRQLLQSTPLGSVALAGMLQDLKKRRRNVWLFVNNHFEGCAPLTIERIQERLT